MSTSPNLSGHGEQIIARCRQIATFTEVSGETTRTFLSAPMHGVHSLLREWMHAANMSTTIDAAGNLRGLYPAATPNAPRLIIASHLDTVPNAGAFDGILGVVLGVAIVEQLQNEKLPFAIEVIGFSDEEGVRYKPFLGSLALTGQLDEATLARTDTSGITIAQAIQNFGLNPAELPAAVLSKDAFAYFEIHIEQGPILESESSPLGIVTAIAGQTRLQLTFTGHANHAGTTPMPLRHDALAAAAQWIVAIEAYAQTHPGLVATVGQVQASPNASNVIPGQVTASLDLRHVHDTIREAALTDILHLAQEAATKRGVTAIPSPRVQQPAVPLHPHITNLLETAARQAGHPSRTMTSGAGHDAMILAPRIPSTMLFLRSPGGLSHHPDEAVLPTDIDAALATAMEFLALLSDDKNLPKESHA